MKSINPRKNHYGGDANILNRRVLLICLVIVVGILLFHFLLSSGSGPQASGRLDSSLQSPITNSDADGIPGNEKNVSAEPTGVESKPADADDDQGDEALAAVAPGPAGPGQLPAGPFQKQVEWRAQLIKSSGVVEKGESLGHVLERMGLGGGEARLIAQATSEVLDLTKIRPGATLALFRAKDGGQPVRVEYSYENTPKVVLIRTPAGYVVSKKEYEPVRCVSAREGNIKASLWESAVKRYGLSPELVMDFADIFRYDIDFLTEVQEGDSFAVLFEEDFCQGQAVGAGKIMAARFVNNGRTSEAFYYENADGTGDYYDGQGQSLKKMFLKSPLQYRRISSHFTHSRLHPILKIRRPHLGVDYAAPTGTPVEALGDGVVTFAGRKGGYGNLVIIQHGKTYTTQYGHLSKFAAGLKNGQRVTQGQLIAYVGSTGLSSGPHLDFRVQENGTFIDPLSVKLQPAPPIPEDKKQEFLAQVALRRAEMSRILAQMQ
jgi:murein DD-endopeptidase MepM/ murein hydrolase activator NlpD